ncbi:hypothetical protein [Streptomyces sp. NPDC001530]|uniref:hypothetical protein n=1 Tax=Streptomyces sp. NPDC001530 TaxID=3364582 RepID=UPI0036A1493F
MTAKTPAAPLDRLDATLATRSGLRVRIVCPSQEFSAQEMSFGVGRWLSSSRGLWESLNVASDNGLALIMLQAPPVGAGVEDYLLGVVPSSTACADDRRARHALVEIDDDSDRHLSEKVLDDARLVRRLRRTLDAARRSGHTVEGLACFASSRRMAALARALGTNLLEADPQMLGWGDKSGSRQLFRSAGVSHLPGSYVADHDVASLAARLSALVRAHGPGNWVVKLDRGFGSGHGNALVAIGTDCPAAIERELCTTLRPMGPGVRRAHFLNWLRQEGAIVEQHVRSASAGRLRYPSALAFLSRGQDTRIRVESLGVHDQHVGVSGDFLGCRYPADRTYRDEVARQAAQVFSALAARGVVGHVGVDFIVASFGAGSVTPSLFATEINVRQTGSTHPNRTVRAVVPLARDTSGELRHRDGHDVCFRATDSVLVPSCRGLSTEELIGALRRSPRLSLNSAVERGVVPHLWPAFGRFGKVGATVIGRSADECDLLMSEFTELLESLGNRVAQFPEAVV